MEATCITYDKHLLVQFDELLKDGEIIIKNSDNKILHKQRIQNKNFTMIELKEEIAQLSIEILDHTNKDKKTVQTI